ncbi:MAG: hypothetical protein B7Z08_09680 [Sphingomonadales bacterium 32-68-7]|nr:MAG: hypothetical protein B7Z33_06740 [Sphingomonadales bacterium 12-68-11]OYX08428.1 MAG: hypothetical protein B7Z08_09680 [Sphingomonadales bacterium 32-68-7]
MADTDPIGETTPQGPFALSGPTPRTPSQALPLRGDLAHIGLAGRYFVPHYAVPQPRAVLPGGAPLKVAPNEHAEALCDLLAGQSFEVLEVSGDWAWGCLSLAGPTGYVRSERLEPLP